MLYRFLLWSLMFFTPWQVEAQVPPPLRIGAIRWDAWIGDKGVPGRAVQKALGPTKWHYRLPFYAKVLGPDQVEIDGTTQDIMDREIDYAVQAKLDYWAFVLYDADNPMSLALSHYLSSCKRHLVDFCLVTGPDNWRRPEMVNRMMSLMKEKGYLTVLDGRPVIYILVKSARAEEIWGPGAPEFRAIVDRFRANIMASGQKDPYMVIMNYTAEDGKRMADLLGGDALSSYNTYGNTPGGRSTFEQRMKGVRWFWDQCKATGAQVVPIISLSAGRAPRVENPVPWEPWQKPGEGDLTDTPPTSRQVYKAFRGGMRWAKANRAANQSGLLIVYAWNENDEGGWMVPTLREGAARVDALAKAVEVEGK